MNSATGGYDESAAEYASYVAMREEGGIENDPLAILPGLLRLLGDVSDREILDAGCGEGYLARILAHRGAHVTGIDFSAQLIEMARARSPGHEIVYQVADLSKPLPAYAGRFDQVASYLVLNSVQDRLGFAATLASVLKPGGTLVQSLLNPYGAFLHRRVRDYFDSGVKMPHPYLLQQGIETYHYHHTLEEYVDAFLAAGLRLTKLADLRWRTPFPSFMLLAFEKPC
jgi:2-polyprenyl-3-methyl-5-hydroxy-6-metoxy-1,4-benzoquinol methylase